MNLISRIFGDIFKAWQESAQARFNIIASLIIGWGIVFVLGRGWKRG